MPALRLYPWKYVSKLLEIHYAAKCETRDAFPEVAGLDWVGLKKHVLKHAFLEAFIFQHFW